MIPTSVTWVFPIGTWVQCLGDIRKSGEEEYVLVCIISEKATLFFKVNHIGEVTFSNHPPTTLQMFTKNSSHFPTKSYHLTGMT